MSSLKEVISISTLDLVECLSTAMDLVSPALANHQRRVGFIALRLAEQLGMESSLRKEALIAGLLHDSGALSMQDRVMTLNFELGSTDSFSPHQHAFDGYRLIRKFRPFIDVAQIVRFHHLPWENGKGATYCDEEVPLGAHLIHLADRIDVLISDKTNILLQRQHIIDRIESRKDQLFHPQLLEAFVELAGKEAFWLDVANVSMGTRVVAESGFAHEKLDCDDLLDMTELFGHIIDFRCRFTATHSSGVSACAASLARLARFSESECMMMKIAGNLHDLGKLAVPVEILEKPAPLTDAEFSIVKAHTYYTFMVLRNFREMDNIREWAAYHHERLDGKGYPFHLRGDELSMGARVMAVADVFTAITEDRPYRSGMTPEDARRVLVDMAENKALDGDVVQLMLDNFAEVNHMRVLAQTASLDEYQAFYQTR
ncbi:MAG: HD domain-containing protein [Desulfobulbaceae bacterium]|nr:HD domain-containing protein [Desulfobulbaceae bacterium]